MKFAELIDGLDRLTVERRPCVYFLCQGEEVVYVGQTTNLLARLAAHMTEKTFDDVYYLAVPESDLVGIETRYIRKLRPRLNVQHAKAPWCIRVVRRKPKAPRRNTRSYRTGSIRPRGNRWLIRWTDGSGHRRSQSFGDREIAEHALKARITEVELTRAGLQNSFDHSQAVSKEG